MKTVKGRLSKNLFCLLVLVPSATLFACSAEVDSGEPTEPASESSANSDLALAEDVAGDPDLAAAIAESKLGALGSTPDIPKHASCGQTGSTASPVRNNDAPSSGAANQRSGSSTSCGAVGVLQPTDDADYYCYTASNDGFTWTYNKNIRTGVRGWTRDDLLDDGGSWTYCGF